MDDLIDGGDTGGLNDCANGRVLGHGIEDVARSLERFAQVAREKEYGKNLKGRGNKVPGRIFNLELERGGHVEHAVHAYMQRMSETRKRKRRRSRAHRQRRH